MLNRIIALLVCVAAWVSLVPAAADGPDTRPATAIRWDIAPQQPDPKYTKSEPKTYQLPVQFTHLGGFDVDQNGRIYVFDYARRQLFRFSSTGRLECVWSAAASSDSDAHCKPPGGMSVTSDGSVLIGPWAVHDTKKHTYRMTSVLKVGPAPGQSETIPIPDHIGEMMTAAADGEFFVYDRYVRTDEGHCTPHSAIYVFSAGGTMLKQWEVPEIGWLAVGLDGLIYCSESAIDGRILGYNRTGRLVREIKQPTSPASWGYGPPCAVAANGDLFYKIGPIVYRLDSHGNPTARWYEGIVRETFLSHSGGLRFPNLVFRNGLLYTIDYGRIAAYTPDGQCAAVYLPRISELNMPEKTMLLSDGSYVVQQASGIFRFEGEKNREVRLRNCFELRCLASGLNGCFYVTGTHAQLDDGQVKHEVRIQLLNEAGEPTSTLYAEARDSMLKTDIGAAAVDPRTHHLWAMTRGEDLLEFSPDRGLLTQVKFDRKPWAQFRGQMAVDPEGLVYLTESQSHRLYQIDFKGSVLHKISTKGSGLGELYFPEGVAVDKQGRVYVADSGNSRIQVFDSDLKPIGCWGKWGTGPGELNQARGITIAPDNTIGITDTCNDRILRVPMARFWSELRSLAQ
jgi:hypothetical protein